MRTAKPAQPFSQLTIKDRKMNSDYEYDTKCSICFSNPFDFCFKVCRDQFCYDCFSKYIESVISLSYGYRKVEVKCPSCLDYLDYSDWSQYVLDTNILDKWNKFNSPFRPLKSTCGSCDFENTISKSPLSSESQRRGCFHKIAKEIEILCHNNGQVNSKGLTIISTFNQEMNIFLATGATTLPEIYTSTVSSLQDYIKYHMPATDERKERIKFRLAKISRLLVSLEVRSDEWRKLQIKHISLFPCINCSQCSQSFCFSCGNFPFHHEQSCRQFATLLVESSKIKAANEESIKNLRWKLDHSKNCPCCGFSINREEGCNKVECSFCGEEFCWSCLGNFNNGKCSFYLCEIQGKLAVDQDSPTEIGVPEIATLNKRI